MSRLSKIILCYALHRQGTWSKAVFVKYGIGSRYQILLPFETCVCIGKKLNDVPISLNIDLFDNGKLFVIILFLDLTCDVMLRTKVWTAAKGEDELQVISVFFTIHYLAVKPSFVMIIFSDEAHLVGSFWHLRQLLNLWLTWDFILKQLAINSKYPWVLLNRLKLRNMMI